MQRNDSNIARLAYNIRLITNIIRDDIIPYIYEMPSSCLSVNKYNKINMTELNKQK